MYNVTLTPNRSNPPWFVKMITYEQRGGKVTRLLKRYSRGACTGSKVIPFDRNKDWTHVPGERYTPVADHMDLGIATRKYTAEDYANGAPIPTEPKVFKETPRVRVYYTAKRDWLIAMGAISPAAPNDHVYYEATWVPGDTAYAEPIVPEYEDGDMQYITNRMKVTSVDLVDEETHDAAIYGGYYEIKRFNKETV